MKERIVEVGPGWIFTRQVRNLHIVEALVIQMVLQLKNDLFGVLVGHKAEVNLRARQGGEDCLRSRSLVAGCEPTDRACWTEYLLPQQFGAAFDALQKTTQVVGAAILLGHIWELSHELEITLARWQDAVIKTRQADMFIGSFE